MPAAGSSVAEALACRIARDDDERERHFAIRRAVFCGEQGMFGGADDRDEHDDADTTLHAVGAEHDVVGGTVRLYPLPAAGLWRGDRLAVLPAFRHGSLGGSLVRFAVRTAGEAGGERMVAMIQVPNVGFFTELGWSVAGDVEPYHGVDHRPMDIDLRSFNGRGR